MNYISIKPIQFGELQEKTANGITWTVGSIQRNASDAVAYCGLIYVHPDGSSEQVATFNVPIDNAHLQMWGADDSIIDEVVMAYSPLFQYPDA